MGYFEVFDYVPNVPCGVERRPAKDKKDGWEKVVPNVPCGVESSGPHPPTKGERWVPNVPCGVERSNLVRARGGVAEVPNVPCGVERPQCSFSLIS